MKGPAKMYIIWLHLAIVFDSSTHIFQHGFGMTTVRDENISVDPATRLLQNSPFPEENWIFEPLEPFTYDPDTKHETSSDSLSEGASSTAYPDLKLKSAAEHNEKEIYTTESVERDTVTPELEARDGSTNSSDGTYPFSNPSKIVCSTEPGNMNIVGQFGETFHNREEQQHSNRTDHCGYYFSDKSCPWPTLEEVHQIDTVCDALEIQMDTIFCISLALGLPGSVLAFITVSSMDVRPSTLYMKLLAVSDFAALLLGIQLFKMPNVGTFTLRDMIPMWLCRLFQAFSHWILALMCAERFVSVQFPFHKSSVFTMTNTRLTAVVAFIISAVPFTWSCLHYSIHDYGGYMVFHLNVIHNLIYSLVPGTLIVIFSGLTALQLRRGAKRRKAMMSTQIAGTPSKLDAVLTRMMFVISICFVVINTPWAVIHVYDNVRILFCPLTEAIFSFFYYGCLSFTFANHAINFYVYYGFAKGFRNNFWRVIRCVRERD